MSARLHPSFVRAAAYVLAALIALAAAIYFWQGYHEHHWSTRGYIISLLIPFTIMPLVVCFAWVPSRLEFNDTDLIIQFPLRRLRKIPWDDLEYYGWFEGVFGLQFYSAGTFTIYTQALPRREWRMFKTFLRTTFPERKASGYIRAGLFQWRRRKT